MNVINSTLPKSTGLKKNLAMDQQYAVAYETLVLNAVNLTAGELSKRYAKEYVSWRNRKKYANDNDIPWEDSMNDFSGFLVINGQIPHENWTLDRINPTGGYLPENLRWASKATQSQNRTNACSVKVDGESLTYNELSLRTGKSYDSIRMGIKRNRHTFLSNLLFKPQANEDIWSEARQWTFPNHSRYALEGLYRRRKDQRMLKPRFFVELVAFELKVRQDILKSYIFVEDKQEAEADIYQLSPLLKETQKFIDDINKRLYFRYSKVQAIEFKGMNHSAPASAPDCPPDYCECVGESPWVTYPKQIDPVLHLFPGFGK
jgi:hypothetical protein